MSINGKVKWFNPTKGYGFIERDDKEKDVFVHSSAAQAASLELREGDQLTFDVETGEKGPSGGMSEEQKALLKELLEILTSKNVITTEEQIKIMSYLY